MTIGRRPDPATTPVIIIVRDRLEPLQLLVAWLERAGARHLVPGSYTHLTLPTSDLV